MECAGLKSADLDSSDKWRKWLSKTGHRRGCSERQKSKKTKPALKHSLWKYKAAAIVKRLDKIPKT